MPMQPQFPSRGTPAHRPQYHKCRMAATALSAAAAQQITSASPAQAAATAAASVFQSSSIPNVTLADYAGYIAARTAHGEDAVLLGLALMGRYCKMTGMLPTPFTEHRLLLAAIVVASKTHYDDFYKNVYMARIGGVTSKELVELESGFLEGVQYHCNLRYTELCDFIEALIEAGNRLAHGVASQATIGRLIPHMIAERIRGLAPAPKPPTDLTRSSAFSAHAASTVPLPQFARMPASDLPNSSAAANTPFIAGVPRQASWSQPPDPRTMDRASTTVIQPADASLLYTSLREEACECPSPFTAGSSSTCDVATTGGRGLID